MTITTLTTVIFTIPDEMERARDFERMNPECKKTELSSAIYFQKSQMQVLFMKKDGTENESNI